MKLRRSACGCSNRQESEELDVKLALDNLSKKYTELATITAQYMAQAGMERTARASNALVMSEMLARIVGGRPVVPGEFSECCLIGRRFPNGTERWFCTGVLVHPRVVLTAGHCQTPASPINLVALEAENFADLSGAKILSVRKVVVNPGFPTSGQHDISVLILRSAARTAPVQIATSTELAAAQRTTLVGFGNDDVLSTRGFGIKREVEVPITHLRRSAADNLDADEQQMGFESDLEFVAGGAGFDSCNGDSGGPAYINVNGTLKVAGLTSRGIPGTNNPCGEGGIYTRIDTQMSFIRQVMQDSGIQPAL
jgi:endonuclease G